MADTIYAKDGKVHSLVGSTTLESIVREYCGDDAARAVRDLEDGADEATTAIQVEIESYQADLEHWHAAGEEGDAAVETALRLARAERINKKELIEHLEKLSKDIYSEL